MLSRYGFQSQNMFFPVLNVSVSITLNTDSAKCHTCPPPPPNATRVPRRPLRAELLCGVAQLVLTHRGSTADLNCTGWYGPQEGGTQGQAARS